MYCTYLVLLRDYVVLQLQASQPSPSICAQTIHTMWRKQNNKIFFIKCGGAFSQVFYIGSDGVKDVKLSNPVMCSLQPLSSTDQRSLEWLTGTTQRLSINRGAHQPHHHPHHHHHIHHHFTILSHPSHFTFSSHSRIFLTAHLPAALCRVCICLCISVCVSGAYAHANTTANSYLPTYPITLHPCISSTRSLVPPCYLLTPHSPSSLHHHKNTPNSKKRLSWNTFPSC